MDEILAPGLGDPVTANSGANNTGDLIPRLNLLRIRPGHIPEVLATLEELHGRNAQDRPGHFEAWRHIALGDYDLLILSFASPNNSLVLGPKWVSDILGVREIPAFLWSPRQPQDAIQLIRDNHQRALLSVVFAQVNPRAYRRVGSHTIERTLAAAVKPECGLVLGLFGTPELAILNWCDSLSEVAHHLDNIVAQSRELERSRDSCSLLYRTLTLVTVPSEAQNVKCPPSGGIATQEEADAVLELNLSQFPGSGRDLTEEAENLIKATLSPRRTLGVSDLTISIPVQCAADLCNRLSDILVFRKQARRYLLATASTLHLGQPKQFADAPPEAITIPPIEGLAWNAIRTNLGDAGRRFVRTVFGFNDIGANALLAPSLMDLVPAMAAMARRAADFANRADLSVSTLRGDAEDELANRLAPIHDAVDQRTIAAQAALSPIESHSRYLVGGIARFLLAAESIPISLFNHMERHWFGYAVSGALSTGFVQRDQVLNIPHDALWRPEEWFVLIHETIHAYVEENRKTLFNDQDQSAEQLGGVLEHVRAEMGDTQVDRPTLLEALVDILSFNCGPAWHPKLYFRSVWNHLLPEGKKVPTKRVSAWLARSACVYLANSLGTGEEPLTAARAAERVTKMLCEFSEWGLPEDTLRQLRSAPLARPENAALLHTTEPLLRFARSRCLFDASALQSRARSFPAHADVIRAAVNGEEVSPGKEIRPELLVWKLCELADEACGPNAAFLGQPTRYRSATVLVLIDRYWSMFYGFRERGAKPASP